MIFTLVYVIYVMNLLIYTICVIENDHFWDPGHVFGQNLTQYQVYQNIIKLEFTQIPVSSHSV